MLTFKLPLGKLNLVISSCELAVLPTGFWKSLIFRVLVRMKEMMTGKLRVVVVVCPLQRIVYDQME